MVTQPSFPFTFALVGAGTVGTSVARLLQEAGNEPVAVASRSELSAQRASFLLTAPVTAVSDLPEVDVVLIGAGDDAIEGIAGQVAGRSSVVAHFAGAYGLGPLERAIRAGAWGCAIHPVQACPDIDTAIARLPGSAWGVTCTWPAEKWAHRLIGEQLGGTPVDVPEDVRAMWHAAAVSTSNGIAALMAVGERLLGAIGVEDPVRVLGPLARGTVENGISGGGGAATLTGPAVRGETDTIERHLVAIKEIAPELVEAYSLVAQIILEVGRVDESVAASIKNLLDGAR